MIIKSFIKTSTDETTGFTKVVVTCPMCKAENRLSVPTNDLMRWAEGELVQRAMPYLSADERELLVSGFCSRCYDKIFGGV